MRRVTTVLAIATLLASVGCATEPPPLTTSPPSEAVRLAASSPTTSPPPSLPPTGPVRTEFESFDRDNFSNPTVIDNKWLPLKPWTKLVFHGTTNEGGLEKHRVVSIVTDMTKVIDGIETLVIWDLDYSDDSLAERELAFFAQDDDGNVWRMGEHPEEFQDGVFVEAPTWLAGLAGARAGIAMKHTPDPDEISYSQGWGPAVEFIDRAIFGGFHDEECVAAGCFADVLVIDEFNVEEPGAFQHKYFAAGIGNIRVDWSGADETREELELVAAIELSGADIAAARSAVRKLEAHAYEISPDLYGLTEPIDG